jgi:hypothetical protein
MTVAELIELLKKVTQTKQVVYDDWYDKSFSEIYAVSETEDEVVIR